MGHKVPDRRLTDAQRKLAERNLRLAYYLAKRLQPHFPGITPDDVDAIAVDALLIAASAFKPQLGFTFTTYAWTVIRRRAYRACQALAKRGFATTYITPDLEETIPSRIVRNPLDDLAAADECRAVSARMTPRQWQILWWRFVDGYTLAEVGEIMGITKERVRQLQEKGKRKARTRT